MAAILTNTHPVLRELLIQVLLKDLKGKSIPILESTVVVTEFLEAVVGQVDVVVEDLHVVLEGRGPQVALLAEKDLISFSYDGPDTDVELPSVVQ